MAPQFRCIVGLTTRFVVADHFHREASAYILGLEIARNFAPSTKEWQHEAVLPQSKRELAFVRVSGNTLAEEHP